MKNALRFTLLLLRRAALTAGFSAALLPLSAQQPGAKPALDITAYTVDARLDPTAHTLQATAKVTFTALEDLDQVTFGLHPALKVSRVTDATGGNLSAERGPNATIRVTPAQPLPKGTTATYTFTYDGTLSGTEDGPVQGLKLAVVGDPISYLLYAGEWFPMTGYLTDRFTADMKIDVPSGYRVIASGQTGKPQAADDGGQEYDFRWNKPGFPGTVIAGKFADPVSPAGTPSIKVYTTPAHQSSAADYANTASRELTFFAESFGPAESGYLNVVELPDDTVPAYWAPELAAVSGSNIAARNNYRLLANTIAHQWWGSEVSPATLNDAWITNGMSRYGELMYLESAAGKNALNAALADIAAGALAYDTIPLTSAARLDPFTPQFQSMTLEKGAMVFHMLRGEVGDDNFKKILEAVLNQHKDGSVTTGQFEKIATANAPNAQLAPFFAQWLDGTGAPQFTNTYTVYRLGNGSGFRTVGQIQQDLDLFNMPVELSVETEGKTETKKIDVVGTTSQYVIDTFGMPRKIVIDPNNYVLKNTQALQVRVAILRGQQLMAQGDIPGALGEYQKALEANPASSLANYRIGEALFQQRNYQAAVNSFRDSLRGDDDPRWTEVWSHIEIGKIFDLTGQRDRAVSEYRQAIQTNDNTQGAVNQARAYLQKPYQRPDAG
jgi:aminopeptidase N